MATVLASEAPDDLTGELTRLFASEPAAMADPFPLWNRLREQHPTLGFADAHLFSRFSSVKTLIDSPAAGTNSALKGRRAAAVRSRLTGEQKVAFDEVSAFEALYMSRTDGDVHDRLRRIAQRTFTPRRISLIQQVIERTAEELLDASAGNAVIDVMEFAYRLPLIIIGDMLGVPRADLDMLHGWSSKIGRNRGGTEAVALMEAHQALREFRAYVEGMIRDIRQRPRVTDDVSLLADLLDANQGEFLSEIELTAMFVVLLFAGHETTTNLIGSGMRELLIQGEWQRVRDNPDLMSKAVEEILRFVSPVQWTGRVILSPIEIDGVRLQEGDTAMLLLAAANRDPAMFDRPDEFIIERKGSRNHLAFGMGAHFCLGSPLARMEGMIALSALARRYPGLQLATDTFDWQGNAMLRSLVRLPVTTGAGPHQAV